MRRWGHGLTERLWDEWGAIPPGEGPLAGAECSGLVSGLLGGEVPVGGAVLLRTRRLRAARRLLRLWRRTSWAGRWNIADALDLPPDHGERVTVHLPVPILEELEALAADLAERASPSDAHWAWLRGLWGSCGSLYFPRTGYYLVLRLSSGVAARARGLLARTGIPWGARQFHGAHESILRDQGNIVTFLCNIGLAGASLQLEQRAMVRSMRDQANRVSNCDAANIRRTLRVAAEQTRLASRIAREGMLPSLPPALRELAEARLASPEASLSELGEKLSPPIQKSTVKYRWARLSDYVNHKGVSLN